MNFKLYLENYNKDVLNNFLHRQSIWSSKRKAGELIDFQYTQEEINEIDNLIREAKLKITSLINQRFQNEWRQYQIWEKKASSIGILWGAVRASFESLGPAFKIGNFDFSNPQEAIVPQDFYHLLMWRQLVKYIESQKNGGNNTVSAMGQAIRRLATLMK